MNITISLRSASIHASISSSLGRAIPKIVELFKSSLTIAFTIFFSKSEIAGKPTAISFTPISSSIFAKCIFSSRVR